jgi:AmiR/NasT family two-component response regulator
MLYLHRRDPFILGGADLVTALALAQVGAAAVLTDFADIGAASADGLWPGRNEIAQATGMIAVQRNVSLDVALAELRGAAYAQNRPITDVAADVIDRRIAFTHPV